MRVRALWFVGMLVGSTAAAAEQPAQTDPGPDIDLLEYLGSLVQARDDKWVGPEDMRGAAEDPDASIVLDGDAAAPDTMDFERVN
jgi:hypothetical protein